LCSTKKGDATIRWSQLELPLLGGEDHALRAKAQGATLWDVDGNRYIDYRLAFGPIILGMPTQR